MTTGTRVRNNTLLGASLNRTRYTSRRTTRDVGGDVLVGTTISAVASTDSIDDSGNGLGVFTAGKPVIATGLGKNDRPFVASTIAADSIVTSPGAQVSDASAGGLVDLRAW